MDDVCVAGRPARRPGEGEEEERQQQRPPPVRAQVVDDPVAVGDPVVSEGGRRDHLHLDAGSTHVLDSVLHEQPGHVTRVARVRRGEDDDLHGAARRRRAKTAGATTTRAANTKK